MGFINRTVGKILTRHWTSKDIEKYIGSYSASFLAYARDDELRSHSASGGAVSAMLINALEQGLIDGALVSKTVIDSGRVRGEFFIATTRDEILSAQGSIYVEMKFGREALPLISNFPGKVAIVGLPCQIDIMRRHLKRNNLVKEKTVCLIALVCGHSSQKQLIDDFTVSLEQRVKNKLQAFHFRRGHWRGKYSARFVDGTEIENPFSEFSLYQNLYFWSEKKCFQCHDHFGYNADISAGDIWSIKLKDSPIKHTGIILRSEFGQRFFNESVQSGHLEANSLDIHELMEGQARTGPFHYNISARISPARRYRLILKDTVFESSHWNHRLVANMAMFNWAWSQNKRWKGLIFRVPKPILKLYLYIFKFLESF
jgi:coenzyme F420 hydrogenase subunit beta